MKQKNESVSSEMRKKRKAEIRANFKSTHGIKRLEFIWMYYKVEMFAAVIIIIMAILGIQALMQLRYKDMLYMVVVNSGGCNTEAMMEEFRDSIGDDNKYHNYECEYLTIADTSSGDQDFAMSIRLTAFTSSDLYDVIIADDFTLETYEANENFMRMDEYLEQSGIQVDQNLIKNNVGIDFSDYESASKYNFSTSNGLYIMINSNSNHMDVVNEFVEFLLAEE